MNLNIAEQLLFHPQKKKNKKQQQQKKITRSRGNEIRTTIRSLFTSVPSVSGHYAIDTLVSETVS